MTDINVENGRCGRLFYDADCAWCAPLAEHVRGLLGRRRIELEPLQSAGVSAALGIPAENVLQEMKFLTEAGEVFGGAEAAAQIARRFWWSWPLFALSRLPGVMPAFGHLYRWIADRRGCSGGACRRRRPGRVLSWLPVVALPGVAFAFKPKLHAWEFMWVMALAIFCGCKWLTWREAGRNRARGGAGRSWAYLFAWPGMDASEFLADRSIVDKPQFSEWVFASFKTLAGAALVWGAPRWTPSQSPLLVGWIGMIGLVFLLHFGLFHLLALVWQQVGINAQPLMRAPILATSLGEFWGKRWNAAFHQLAHAYAFLPLRRMMGVGGATFLVFLISGLIHEVVISLPAGDGYGLPTLYFLVQGLGLCFERSKSGERLGLGRGWWGRLFPVLCPLAPLFWLFPPPFIRNVILPFLRAIGVT